MHMTKTTGLEAFMVRLGLMDLTKRDDFHEHAGTLFAIHRLDIAPLAYEFQIQAPLCADILEQLVEFGSGANPDSIRTLYSRCNGLRVGATKFSIYGVRAENMVQPWDINRPNIYGRPPGYPDDVLIVGHSTENAASGVAETYYHVIEPGPFISIHSTSGYNKLLRRYSSVIEWLMCEIVRALEDQSRY
jgi:hypothetical protein